TVVIGSLSLASGAQLSFDTSKGPIQLFVTDALNFQSHSLLSTSTSKPQDVTLTVPGATAATVALRSDGPVYGMVYAPGTKVALGSQFELFGALVAANVSFDAATKLHFDTHFAELATSVPWPEHLSWRIVQLDNFSSDLASDPFSFLGVVKS